MKQKLASLMNGLTGLFVMSRSRLTPFVGVSGSMGASMNASSGMRRLSPAAAVSVGAFVFLLCGCGGSNQDLDVAEDDIGQHIDDAWSDADVTDSGDTPLDLPSSDLTCSSDCTGRVCGLDPVCGQSCGICDSDKDCTDDGRCVLKGPVCPGAKNCAGLKCGLDPVCDEPCGTCEAGDECQFGACVPSICATDCVGVVCGPGPVCGLQCGTCRYGYACQSGQCMEIELVDGMALVPAGAFWMGCDVTEDVQCREEESPYHEVTLDAYYIDRTEVTQGAYRNCIDAGQCSTPVNDWDPVRKSNRPVAWVSWDQAMAYCTWAGKRLPTEAEWEKAARGTDSWNYPWGNSMATCEYAVMHWDGDAGCGTGSTLDVCSKSPQGDSPYGLCDMSGNLDEWVSDYYRRDYYAESPPINPTGPVHGGGKVIRGGNYVDHYVVANLRASRRLQYSQQSSLDSIGFRCARDAL